jgi:hypothetical protein
VRRSIKEHNLLAASKIYSNISVSAVAPCARNSCGCLHARVSRAASLYVGGAAGKGAARHCQGTALPPMPPMRVAMSSTSAWSNARGCGPYADCGAGEAAADQRLRGGAGELFVVVVCLFVFI